MQKATVMVVDDEIPYCDVIQEILSSQGYQVITANNPRQAWDLLQNHRPDIILMDIMMPGFDGIRFTQELKKKPSLAEIPIVMVSAKTSQEDRLRAQEVGAKAFLQKPFTSLELRETLEEFLMHHKTL
jgi:CheY-like chemotaxis protein